ncbi:MAG: UDP-N-acetylmuramoyl-L-alanine--D-glutamate ligase [Glaciecola sp.]
MQHIAQAPNYTEHTIAIIGYGVTGKACARFLLNKGVSLTVYDSEAILTDCDEHDDRVTFKPLHASTNLLTYSMVIVSPGVNLQQDFIQQYHASGKRVISDIELFALENDASVIAVTGSNGKSTVVDMLSKVIQSAGLKVGLGGNFGRPALSMLDHNYDVVILELSSFQLESTYHLYPLISCVLNVTPDHMDRHGCMENYAKAKQSIYSGAMHRIFNRDDALSYPLDLQHEHTHSIGLHKPTLSRGQKENHHCYQNNDGVFINNQLVLHAANFEHQNQYQLLNMQVVLICMQILHISPSQVLSVLYQYEGLAHRFQMVRKEPFCCWINDSKATNPGAAIAAIENAAKRHDAIVLIAGGDGKGANMDTLLNSIENNVQHLVLIGKDAHLFTDLSVSYELASTMAQAVEAANQYASRLISQHINTAILLAPACASIDMFANYQDRGQQFTDAVLEVSAS